VDNWLTEENRSLREMISNLLHENEQLKQELEKEKQLSRWRDREGEIIFNTKT